MNFSFKKNKDSTKENKTKKEPIERQDLICYIGAGVFLILAILPIVIRNLDPNYDPNRYSNDNKKTEEKKKIVYSSLLCNRNLNEEGYSYTVEITNNYADDVIQNSIINYIITLDPAYNILFDEIEIPEYKMITETASNGIYPSVEGQSYIIRIDYNVEPTLRENQILENHNKNLTVQRNNYETNGYMCTIQ